MKTHPYIGKSGQGNDYLVASSNLIYSFISRSWMADYNDGFAPIENTTNEYLANTYGEVASPEHAEFIVELCSPRLFNGFARDVAGGIKYFEIKESESDGLWLYLRNDKPRSKKLKQITIPLPPKVDKQELSEWPKNGDKCISNDELCTFLCKSPFGSEAVIARDGSDDWDVISVPYSDLKKPKTPEEDLRDELEIALNSFVLSDKPASEHIDQIISLFKKPQ